MNISYMNPGFEKMIESIMMFQTEGESPLSLFVLSVQKTEREISLLN